jgi:rhodanese-related sulfurtransferase
LKLPSLWWLPFGKVPEISPQKLHKWLENGGVVQLVDSRTSLEYQGGTIGRAQPATVTDLPGALDKLDLDPDRPVVFLCLTGHRSRPGTRLLRAKGFQAYNLEGGVMAWKRAGYPLTEPQEKQTQV